MAFSFYKDLRRELNFSRPDEDEVRPCLWSRWWCWEPYPHSIKRPLLQVQLACQLLPSCLNVFTAEYDGQGQHEDDDSDQSVPERLVAMAIPSAAQHVARTASPFQHSPPGCAAHPAYFHPATVHPHSADSSECSLECALGCSVKSSNIWS